MVAPDFLNQGTYSFQHTPVKPAQYTSGHNKYPGGTNSYIPGGINKNPGRIKYNTRSINSTPRGINNFSPGLQCLGSNAKNKPTIITQVQWCPHMSHQT